MFCSNFLPRHGFGGQPGLCSQTNMPKNIVAAIVGERFLPVNIVKIGEMAADVSYCFLVAKCWEEGRRAAA